mmetsp:Transcript_71530/g.180526  ORF Transcript_71530/g.180526 Transcript_71530/m.180526 type:complete len:88 (+) Transcript_71530:499-762(+)
MSSRRWCYAGPWLRCMGKWHAPTPLVVTSSSVIQSGGRVSLVLVGIHPFAPSAGSLSIITSNVKRFSHCGLSGCSGYENVDSSTMER